MNHIQSLGAFHYLFRGFSMLFQKGIKRYVIIPVLINFIFFVLLIFTGIYFINYLSGHLPDYLRWLKWIFDIIFVLGGSIMLVYTFTIVTNIIGAPFNSLLSEKVEIMVAGQKPNEDEGIKAALKDAPRAIKRNLRILFYYLPRAILLLILFIIPVINLIASVLWFIFGCWMMSMQYLDYPLDNHKITFKDMYQHLRKHCIASMSFGCAVMIVSMIPIINFFVMPAAVIGGTLMYLDQTRS